MTAASGHPTPYLAASQNLRPIPVPYSRFQPPRLWTSLQRRAMPAAAPATKSPLLLKLTRTITTLPDQGTYAILALLAMGTGLWFHTFAQGLLRYHGTDVLWCLSGILAFRAIWQTWSHCWIPAVFAIFWELTEALLPNRTFDWIDLTIYLSLFLVSQFRKKTHVFS